MRGFFAGDGLDQPRRQVERQQVHGVHEEHPHEDRQRERRDEAAVAVEGVLDLAVDELDDQSRRRPGPWTARRRSPCARESRTRQMNEQAERPATISPRIEMERRPTTCRCCA